MDDMARGAAYYHPPATGHYPYYAASPAPPHGVTPPPPLPYPHHEPPPFAASPPFHHYDHHQHHLARAMDGVRTLFVAGLPDDAKPREIYNLFREFPGYESAQLRSSGKSSQAYAFAVFCDQQSALAAMHALNGIVFDLERDSTLHIELAKANSRSKRSRTDDGPSYTSDKKFRGAVGQTRGYPDTGGGSKVHMPGFVTAHSLNHCPSTQRSSNPGYSFVNSSEITNSNTSSTTYVPEENPPCPTIFVANLGPTCSENELAQVFSRCPGFLKLKMQNKNGLPVAFVDFQDEDSSKRALNHLQGAMLQSSVGEGMRLEFAKSRMGLRKREKRRK